MKNILVTVALCLGITQFISAQKKLTTDEQEVQSIIVNVFQALADRNLNSLKSYCTDDLVIYESGLIWNMDTIAQKINKPAPPDFKRLNKIDFIRTKANGNTAWVSCYNQADITANGSVYTRRWLETSVLLKVKNKWKLETLHSTLLTTENQN